MVVYLRENEFGETMSEDELADMARRFRKLNPKQIDEVWYRCGFIITDHEKEYKALRKSDVEAITGGLDTAKEKVWNLISEVYISDVKKALAEMEK
jgi:hypothetical protein